MLFCGDCSLEFTNLQLLDKHLKTHEWPLFSSVILEEKLRKREIPKPFASKIVCPRKDDKPIKFTKVQNRSNSIQFKLKCNFCSRKFTHLEQHCETYHKIPSIFLYRKYDKILASSNGKMVEFQCAFCDLFYQENELIKHFINRHFIRKGVAEEIVNQGFIYSKGCNQIHKYLHENVQFYDEMFTGWELLEDVILAKEEHCKEDHCETQLDEEKVDFLELCSKQQLDLRELSADKENQVNQLYQLQTTKYSNLLEYIVSFY